MGMLLGAAPNFCSIGGAGVCTVAVAGATGICDGGCPPVIPLNCLATGLKKFKLGTQLEDEVCFRSGSGVATGTAGVAGPPSV